MSEHPLNQAIKMRNRAKKSKAHPKILANLEAQVCSQAAESLEKLKGWPELMSAIKHNTKLEMPLSLGERIKKGDFK